LEGKSEITLDIFHGRGHRNKEPLYTHVNKMLQKDMQGKNITVKFTRVQFSNANKSL